MWKTKTIAFLFLSLTGFMILKPIENVLSFDLAIVAELGSDVFNLLGIRSPHSSTIKHLQYPYLFLGWIPSCSSWMRFHSCLEGRRRGGRIFVMIMGGTKFSGTAIGFDEGLKVKRGERGGGGIGGGMLVMLLKFRGKRA